MTYMATHLHKNPLLEGLEIYNFVMKITILVDTSLVNQTVYLVCLFYAWE